MNPDDFTSHGSLQRRWESMGRSMAFDSASPHHLGVWRSRLRSKLRQLTGYDTLEKTAPRPRVTESKVIDGYIRQRVVIRTEAHVAMPMFVLIPAGHPPFPVVIACHGHGMGGKAGVAGCREVPEVARAIDQQKVDYGVQFATAGFIVFCPDARGFGERQEAADRANPMASSCRVINNMAMPLGRTVTGLWTWDIHRLIDYIETRPDCSSRRIGCVGLSGGGHQVLWAAALDERIRCAIISGYFYGYKRALLDRNAMCSCNYVPHLWEHADMGDIGALIAPRPLMIESGAQDPLNGSGGLANVRPQVRVTRRAYRLLDAASSLKHCVFQGEHQWNGAEAAPWMRRHLGPGHA